MKAETTRPSLVNEFPCLMEHKIKGEISVGIYLVSKIEDDPETTFSVCMVAPADKTDKPGDMYFKSELDPKEWLFLPEGVEVKLTN